MMQEVNGSINPTFECEASAPSAVMNVPEKPKSPSYVVPIPPRFSSSSVATIATLPSQADVAPDNSPDMAADYANTPIKKELPTAYPPQNYGMLVFIITLLCGVVNPCALLALKYSYDSAKASQVYNFAKARNDGLRAHHLAIGAVILGAMVLSIIYYQGLVNALTCDEDAEAHGHNLNG